MSTHPSPDASVTVPASPFAWTRNRVFLTYGQTNEPFCLPPGVEVRFERMLHQHLQRQGYQVVVFFSNRGCFVLDPASRAAVQGLTTTGPCTPPALTPAGRLLPHSTGLSLRSKPTVPITPSRWHWADMASPHVMVPLMRRLLLQPGPATAVVFANDDIFATFASSEMNTQFQALVKYELKALSTACRNILIFNFPGLDPWCRLSGHRWDFLLGKPPRGEGGLATPVLIGEPREDEVETYLLGLHLRGAALEARSLPRLVRRLTSHLRANQQGLVFLAGLRSAPRIDDSAVDRLTSTSEGLNRTAQEQLQGLVGLNPFREYIEGKLKGIARLQQQGESSAQLCGDLQRVIPPPSPSWTRKQWLHLALTGNPGTGKTTVAKLLGEIYCEAGILPLGHTVKTSRDGLVDRYLGGTALKVRAAVQRALGGILFIDEAYSLCRGDNDEYGQEAVNTLVDAMSDLNGQFAVVLAGYPTDMDRFLAVNTGLRSRIDKVLILEDYQPAELEQILRQSLARHPGLRLDDELNASLTRLCFALHATRPADFGNARTMEQLASDIHENVAREDGEQAGLRHLPANYRQLLDQPAVGPEGILSELDALVGLRAVKESMRTLFNRLRLEQCRGQAGSRVVSGHMIFEGNPGTGKTTVARLLARQLQALGVLASGAVHPTTASQLIQGYVGQTTVATREFLEGGLGKVIFIDEAHQLAGEPGSHDFGRDALKVLVPFAEDHRQDCVIVLAGYPAPLRRLLDQDPGLASRFPTRLVFEDYSPEEMVEIFDRLLRGQQMSWPAEAGRPRLAEYFRRIRDAQGADFGNARSVRQEVEACLNRLANRLQREGLLNEVAGDLEAVRQLTLMDLPPQ